MPQKRKKISLPSLTGIIIAKNEESKIGKALNSISWADELLVIDTGSVDKTVDIAREHGARVISIDGGSYQDWRNKGLKESKGTWILYLDADERIPEKLRDEIKNVIAKDAEQKAYAIPRKNIILGKEMKYGGQWPDYQKRLFLKSALKEWKGDLHEEPVVDGPLGHLKEPMLHIKHDNISEMVTKTNKWSEIEAKLLFDSNHPQMVPWRFVRIMLTELWLRLIKQKGILDGTSGIIYAIYQMWSRFITYGKLWEMQLRNQRP